MGQFEDAIYLERLRELWVAKDDVERTTGERVAPDRAIDWLCALSGTWTEADVPEAKADVLHAIYDRLRVAGLEIVGVRLTQAAYGHGLALALQQKIETARPTRVGRAHAHSGFRQLLIEGADEWRSAARESA